VKRTSHWPLTILSTVVSLLQLTLPLTLVRLFPAEDIGTYKIFFLYYGLLSFITGSVGLMHGVYYWTHSPSGGKALMQQVWTVLAMQSTIVLVAGVAGSGYVALLLEGSREQALLFVISGSLYLLTSFYEEAWVAEERIWQSALFKALSELVRASLVVYFAWRYRDINLVFFVHTAVMLLKFSLGTALAVAQGMARIVFNKQLLREVLRYALPVSTAGLLAAIANSADQLLLSTLLSKAQFAVFAMGCLAVPPLVALEQSVNQVLAARLSQFLRRGERAAAVQQYAAAVRELSRFMIPACVGLLVFAEPIVSILFTSRYLDSAPVLRLYSLTYLLSGIPYDGGPKASGHGGWALKTFVYKTLIAVALVAVLTPLWGTYGAMTGVLVSGVYLRGAGIFFNIRTLGWGFSEFIPLRSLAQMLALSLALGGVSLLMRDFFFNDRLWLVVMGSAFGLIYGSLYLLPRRAEKIVTAHYVLGPECKKR